MSVTFWKTLYQKLSSGQGCSAVGKHVFNPCKPTDLQVHLLPSDALGHMRHVLGEGAQELQVQGERALQEVKEKASVGLPWKEVLPQEDSAEERFTELAWLLLSRLLSRVNS